MPHKEERFLSTVYPLLCLSAAFAVHEAERIFIFAKFGEVSAALVEMPPVWQRLIRFGRYWMFVLFAALSVSRTTAVLMNYGAPIRVYTELSQFIETSEFISDEVTTCVGKEWYRFPSHFFLPDEPSTHLAFLRSEYNGQLPQLFATGVNATSAIPKNMNDKNQEELSRYVESDKCHFIVDLELRNQREPRYSDERGWSIVIEDSFLDSSRSSTFWRAFYVPFLSQKHCVFSPYRVLKREIH